MICIIFFFFCELSSFISPTIRTSLEKVLLKQCPSAQACLTETLSWSHRSATTKWFHWLKKTDFADYLDCPFYHTYRLPLQPELLVFQLLTHSHTSRLGSVQPSLKRHCGLVLSSWFHCPRKGVPAIPLEFSPTKCTNTEANINKWRKQLEHKQILP